MPRSSDGVITRRSRTGRCRSRRDRRRAQHTAVERLHAKHRRRRRSSRTREPAPNVTCCGARSAGERRPPTASSRVAPAVTHKRPSGAMPDVVRAEAGRERRDVPQSPRVDDRDMRRSAEPRPTQSRRPPVDRDVTRPARQRDPAERRARARRRPRRRRSGPSRSRTRAGRPGGRRCSAARRTRAGRDARACPSTIETRADRGMADDRALPTSSIARGSGSVAIGRTTRNEPRSTTASRASASHVTSAHGRGAVSAARSVTGAAAASDDELATVHALDYAARAARGPVVSV